MKKNIFCTICIISLLCIFLVKLYKSANKSDSSIEEELQNAGKLSEEKIREIYGLSPDSPIVKQTVEFTSTYRYK